MRASKIALLDLGAGPYPRCKTTSLVGSSLFRLDVGSRDNKSPAFSFALQEPSERITIAVLYVNVCPFVAPPGLASETLKTLRSAFDALADDPEFKGEARRLSITGEPMSGASIQELLQRIYSSPITVVDRARSIISQ